MLRSSFAYFLALVGLSACVNPFGEGSFDPAFATVSTAYLALLNPSDVDLGTVPVGQQASRTLIVSNQGGRTAEYLAAELSTSLIGYAGGSFPGVGGSCGKSLAAGESCRVVIAVTPPFPATHQTTFVLRYWDGERARSLDAALKAQADNGTFVTFTGFDQTVQTMVETSDGLYVAGNFTGYGRYPAGRLLRFMPSSSEVDTRFNTYPGFNNNVLAVASGNSVVYVGGQFTNYSGTSGGYLVRLHLDGSKDTTFAPSTVDISEVTRALAVDPATGKVYAALGTTTGLVWRLNTNGSTDNSFVSPVFTGVIEQILMAPDGSGDIYVTGAFTHVAGAARPGIVRLSATGAVVANFDALLDGPIAAGSLAVHTLIPTNDSSGDIFIGGNFTTINGTAQRGLARVDANGDISISMSVGTGFNEGVTKIAMIPGNGMLQVMGGFTSYNGTARSGLARVSDSGNLDVAFAPSSTFNVLDIATGSLVAHEDGSFHAGGSFITFQGQPAPRLVRVDNTGATDSRLKMKSGATSVYSVAALSDGSGVYLGGNFLSAFGRTSAHAARVGYNAEIDTSFTAPATVNNAIYAMLPTTDGTGSVYVAGSFTLPKQKIARLLSSGALDTGFSLSANPNGDVTKLFTVQSPTRQPNLYLVGTFTLIGTTATQNLARASLDGALDTSLIPTFIGAVATGAAVPDGEGDIYLGGSFTTVNATSSNCITRLNWNGTIDTSFQVGTGFSGSPQVAAIYPLTDGSGKVYVGGQFTGYQSQSVTNIARLNADGTLDTTAAFPSFTGGAVMQFVPDGKGRIFVLGNFTAPYKYIARLNADGSLDTSFNPGASFNSTVKDASLAPDGSNELYVGGTFTTYNGSLTDGLIRLNESGALD